MRAPLLALALSLATGSPALADSSLPGRGIPPPSDQRGPAPSPPPPPPEDEVTRNVHMLQLSCSLDPGIERARAIKYFVDHAAETHPRLLALFAGPERANANLIQLLGHLGRPESVAPLERVLAEGTELRSWSAGTALGQHAHPSALAALVRQVRQANKHTVFGATLGLTARRDAKVCPSLLQLRGERTGDVRYYLLQAAGRLGCLDRKEMATLAARDPSEDVRQLMGRILRNAP